MENKKQKSKLASFFANIFSGGRIISKLHGFLAIAIFLGYFIPYATAVVGFFKSTDTSDILERIQAFLVLTRDMAVPIFILLTVILVLRAFVAPKLEKEYEEEYEKLVEEFDNTVQEGKKSYVEKYNKKVDEHNKKYFEKMQKKSDKELEKKLAKMTPEQKKEYEKQQKIEEERLRLSKLAWEAEQKRQAQKK